MTLDEARRRNRRRITVLASIAALNHWAIASLVVASFSWGLVGKFTGDEDLSFRPFLVWGVVAATVLVAVYAGLRVLGSARATVKALGAQAADGSEHQRLRNLAAELAIAAGLRPVALAVLDDPVPNALTVGAGSRSTVVVTSGLLDQLTRDELEAVLAVQMCAIRRLDVALQTLVVACATGTAGIHRSFRDDWKDPRSWFGIALTWPSWMLAEWVRRTAYSQCDMGADDMAIGMTRHPDALRRALVKLLDDPGVVTAVTAANAPLWFEPVPSVGKHLRKDALERYAITPSLEDRIARIDALVG